MYRDFYAPPRSRFKSPKSTRGGGYNFERKQEPPLTGEVQDQRAAQGEERFARTLEKARSKGLIQGYLFRYSPAIPKGLPGWLEVDFVILRAQGSKAVSVKGVDFVHKGESARQEDKKKELLLLTRLRSIGLDIPRIDSIAADSLSTQEQADQTGRAIGVYR